LLVKPLREKYEGKPTFQSLPKYPPVLRDLAFVVDESVTAAELLESVRSSGGNLLKKVQLFDVYTGDQIERGKKSCAFSLEFLSPDRTLTEEEVEKATQQVIRHVGEKLGARVRS
jgi:phenylalanyl-tRNA synthetase beta chain